MTVRQEILDAARTLLARGAEPFSPADIIAECRRSGSTYPDSTIRTHVVSVLCRNAPVNHATSYADLERVGRGKYRLTGSAGGPPDQRS